MTRVVHDITTLRQLRRERQCTIGIHAEIGYFCTCGASEDTRCCNFLECKIHKCGPVVGCLCPVPVAVPRESLPW